MESDEYESSYIRALCQLRCLEKFVGEHTFRQRVQVMAEASIGGGRLFLDFEERVLVDIGAGGCESGKSVNFLIMNYSC